MGTAAETMMQAKVATSTTPFAKAKGSAAAGTCSSGSGSELKKSHSSLRKAASDTTTTGVAAMADNMVETFSQFSLTVTEEEEEEDSSSSSREIVSKCECCGLAEECTAAYMEKTKALFCGRFVCGLCSEAVKEERRRLGGGGGGGDSDDAATAPGMEEALFSHMKVCIKFNTSTRADPAAHLATAMRQILRRSVEQLGVTPSRPMRDRLWQRSGLSRSETFSARGQRNLSLP
ncbi:unnamed protein product [Sphagnum jensenii]|uniref:Uncharacterized protein n=1 Tax=Sphagnum jensenii TaxID=128206 RepID=A0ABP1B9T6_9BRYO